ncbi:MAG: transglycosylase domain-containing protein [Rickettsiales bacterium]|nr:transglycosylase domain-containing protein [Rickettsiales bacterium]
MSILFVALTFLYFITQYHLKQVPKTFHTVLSDSHHTQFTDRYHQPLNITYQNRWNRHDTVTLHEVPMFLKHAFIVSEDKRFYDHSGVDWLARGSALVSNVKAMRAVRGASTITEQVVRMINPRPRTVWSRWLEGYEANALEDQFNKDAILEFYLNQIPYAANRRGIVQAARYYFNRDLDTLSHKEMLALVVLVRAPSRLDLWKNTALIESSITRLATTLVEHNYLTPAEKALLVVQDFQLEPPKLGVHAPEFINYLKQQQTQSSGSTIRQHTTLDGYLQRIVQNMLDQRMGQLASYNVHNGAVLVVDHTSGDILVWAVAGKHTTDHPGKYIDAVTTPRQPGSAMKPLLYAYALEKGWSAATVIEDVPLMQSVGHGLHHYQNFSRMFYGDMTLRQALANSLNIPALKTLNYVGTDDYVQFLHDHGFKTITKHPDYYGDGIALGNAEVTLYELVQSYAALANSGRFQPLRATFDDILHSQTRPMVSPQVASLIGHILSDSNARSAEFGTNSSLNIPIQTAVKTGTSSDYRDSWVVGYNYHYTVGIWMGNMDQNPTDGLTGAKGPALLLRAIFAELVKYQDTRPLRLDKQLIQHEVCLDSKRLKTGNRNCPSYAEWFVEGTQPPYDQEVKTKKQRIKLIQPVQGLHLAMNPRVAPNAQAFEFLIHGVDDKETVRWNINGDHIETNGGRYVWAMHKGTHKMKATIYQQDGTIVVLNEVRFHVK